MLPDSGRINNLSLYLQEVLLGRGEGKRVKKKKKEKKRICKLMKLLKKDTHVRSQAQGLRIVRNTVHIFPFKCCFTLVVLCN